MSLGLLVNTSTGARGEDLFLEVWPWLLGLTAVVCLGATAMYLIRRSLRRQGSTPAEGFTLQQLRDLHAAGELTDEQFQRAKASMIGRLAETQSTREGIGPDLSDPQSAH